MEAGSATEAGATPPELTPFERFQDEVARGGSQGEGDDDNRAKALASHGQSLRG